MIVLRPICRRLLAFAPFIWEAASGGGTVGLVLLVLVLVLVLGLDVVCRTFPRFGRAFFEFYTKEQYEPHIRIPSL